MSDAARRVAWPALVVAVLVAGLVLPIGGGLSLADRDDASAARWTAVLDGLPDEATVIVGFDPDLGTYAEIRPTVRTLMADLLHRNARLAVISLTPEGRALALGELGRLDRLEANPTRLVDLGFLPGAEAALVALARATAGDLTLTGPSDAVDLAGTDLALVVGGNDLGPRSWVEQFGIRAPGIGIAAVTPSVLLPEVRPYLESGQLVALAGTPFEGAGYRDRVDLGAVARLGELEGPAPLAMLAGLLTAIGYLAACLVAPVGRFLRAARGGERR